MAKIYERLLSTNTPQGKNQDSFDPRIQNLSGEDSSWLVDRLEIPRKIDCLFFELQDSDWTLIRTGKYNIDGQESTPAKFGCW